MHIQKELCYMIGQYRMQFSFAIIKEILSTALILQVVVTVGEELSVTLGLQQELVIRQVY